MPLSADDANGYLDYAMELYDLAGDHVDRSTLLATAVGAVPGILWGLTFGFGPEALIVTMFVLWVAWTIGYERGVARTLPLKKAACYLLLMHSQLGYELDFNDDAENDSDDSGPKALLELWTSSIQKFFCSVRALTLGNKGRAGFLKTPKEHLQTQVDAVVAKLRAMTVCLESGHLIDSVDYRQERVNQIRIESARVLIRFTKSEPTAMERQTLATCAEDLLGENRSIPRDLRLALIGMYGHVLQEIAGRWSSAEVLPAAKGILGEAILAELMNHVDLTQEQINALADAYVTLADFLAPDDLATILHRAPGWIKQDTTKTIASTKATNVRSSSFQLISNGHVAETIKRRQDLRKILGRKNIGIEQVLYHQLRDFKFLLPDYRFKVLAKWPKGSNPPSDRDLSACLAALDVCLVSSAANLVRIGDGLTRRPEVVTYLQFEEDFPNIVDDPLFVLEFGSFGEGVHQGFFDVDKAADRSPETVGSHFAQRLGLTSDNFQAVGQIVLPIALNRFVQLIESFEVYRDDYLITD